MQLQHGDEERAKIEPSQDTDNGQGGAESEKPVQAPAHAASPGEFGEDDNDHITGYKLFAALFGIVSVFFIVTLDFSIISTVSTNVHFA